MNQTPQSLVDLRESPFVDRQEQLALLNDLFARTLTRKGQVVFLSGEGGIGKTRLVHELGSHSRKQGAIFAVGTSYEGEGMIPYGPWVEAIRSILAQSPAGIVAKSISHAVAEVGRIVPELAVRARELGIKGWLSGPEQAFRLVATDDAERVRLFQSVTDFLIHSSNQRPLVLFFDDAIWLMWLHSSFCTMFAEESRTTEL